MQTKQNNIRDYSNSLKISRGPMDLPFLLLTLLLLTIGVIMVLSASYASAYYDLNNETGGNATFYFSRQLIFAIMGVVAMYVCSRFPVSVYRKFSFLVLYIAIGLLLAVLVIGTRVNGARRWISLGFTTLQPSEIAKLAVVLSFSVLICKFRNYMGTIKYGVAPFAAILIGIVGLLVLEPHLSASIIILMLGAIMLFAGGARMFWFVAGGIGAVGAFAILINVMQYSSERITAWLHPFEDTGNTGYQIVESLYAIGSGGLFGLGLGNSRQKYLYLPEEHNDFIFSIVCEELGLIGALLILTLFALLIVRGYWIAIHSRDRYSFLVCTGLTSLLAIQVILNVAVCTNLIPCTGISLPFFSYGGTALLMQMAEMGIILSISRDVPVIKTSRIRSGGPAQKDKGKRSVTK